MSAKFLSLLAMVIAVVCLMYIVGRVIIPGGME